MDKTEEIYYECCVCGERTVNKDCHGVGTTSEVKMGSVRVYSERPDGKDRHVIFIIWEDNPLYSAFRNASKELNNG